VYLRADRSEDSAGFGFTAAEDWLVLEVRSACSAHSSVVRWDWAPGAG